MTVNEEKYIGWCKTISQKELATEIYDTEKRYSNLLKDHHKQVDTELLICFICFIIGIITIGENGILGLIILIIGIVPSLLNYNGEVQTLREIEDLKLQLAIANDIFNSKYNL